MFKRLKRIEALLTEQLTNERECLQIVRSRRIEIALMEAQDRRPFKCPWPDCAIAPYHVHMIAEESPAAPQSDGDSEHEG